MTAPYYEDATVTVFAGDCLDVLRELPDCSVDAVVTDPPYNLSFMSKAWDRIDGEPIDPGFMHWLAGFIDGEGCFSVHKKPQQTYDCQFSITLRADDRPILERIQRTLGMGTLSKATAHRTGADNPKARYSVSRKADLVRLRDLLRAFPLRAKKATDFEMWSDALDTWVDHQTGEWDEMAELRKLLMDGRAYKEEGVRVDPFQMWCWRWGRECMRILKPGGHLLSFGGTRTSHRLAAGIEDAGFEIRDSIMWIYGSGFPKSLDVSKAIDKRRDWSLVGGLAAAIRAARVESGLSLREVGEAVKAASNGKHGEWYHRGGHMFFETGMSLPGRDEWRHLREVLPISSQFDATYEEAERQVIQERTLTQGGGTSLQLRMGEVREVNADITAPATDDARTWQGWGTALKPAHEPIVVARKPLEGTVSANVLEWGTGALNVDACRIATDEDRGRPPRTPNQILGGGRGTNLTASESNPAGRWPANVVLDPEAARELDAQSGESVSKSGGVAGWQDAYVGGTYSPIARTGHDDTGGASRFFKVIESEPLPRFRYTAKASADERVRLPKSGGGNGTQNYGGYKVRRCDECGRRSPATGPLECGHGSFTWAEHLDRKPDMVSHPTVKPLALVRWLVRLVTPPGGVILEPFAGSGTTAEACILEGFRCIAIEREPDYLPLIVQRINRRRDPVSAVTATEEDLGLFELLEGDSA